MPKTVRALFGDAFHLYGTSGHSFALTAFIVVVPFDLLIYAFVSRPAVTASGHETALGAVGSLLLSSLLITSLVTVGHLELVQQIGRGERGDVRAALRTAVSSLPRVIPVLVLVALGVILGLIALVVPGIILLLGWQVAVQASVVRRDTGTAALRTSWRLSRGHKGHILGVVLVSTLVGVVLRQLIMGIAGALHHGSHTDAPLVAGGIAADALTLSITALVASLLLFDLGARGR